MCRGFKDLRNVNSFLCCVWQMAAPEGTPNVALRDMAVKLVSLVAVGPSAAAFQAAIAALPPEAKQRLQASSQPGTHPHTGTLKTPFCLHDAGKPGRTDQPCSLQQDAECALCSISLQSMRSIKQVPS